MATHTRWCSCSGEGRTWSLTPVGVPVPDEGHTRSLTPVGVCVSSEGRTGSLTSVGVHVSGEDRTWPLTPVGVRVPVLGEGRMVAHTHSCSCATWSLTPVRVRVPSESHMVARSFVFQFSLTPTPCF